MIYYFNHCLNRPPFSLLKDFKVHDESADEALLGLENQSY